VRLVPKFKEYDRDGNGYISLEEASMILQNKPFNFPADKVVVLLRKFDKDGNGKLDIDEFADFYAEAKATSVSSYQSRGANNRCVELGYDQGRGTSPQPSKGLGERRKLPVGSGEPGRQPVLAIFRQYYTFCADNLKLNVCFVPRN